MFLNALPKEKKITYSHRGLNPIKICAKLLPLNKNIRCINGAEVLQGDH